MVQTLAKRLFTFEEYLSYEDGTDNRYELVNGELVPMNPPIGKHARIARFLFRQFDREIERLALNWIPSWDYGVRTAERKSRLPDLVVIIAEQEEALLNVSAVLQTPPLLAVEIVSEDNPARDYRYKRSEYAVREITEYWIVDPQKSKVTVLTLLEGLYEEQVFTGTERIVSPTFADLVLTAEQVLEARR